MRPGQEVLNDHRLRIQDPSLDSHAKRKPWLNGKAAPESPTKARNPEPESPLSYLPSLR